MKPDLIFVMPDQLRPDFLGCYGATSHATPRIDALADHGTLYETAISPSPICVPARASLLTGQHAHAIGVMDNLHWPRPDRAAMGVASWPERLRDAGWRTAAVGKMHFYPWDLSEGFDVRVIAEDKRHFHIRDDYTRALVAEGFARSHANEQRGYQENKGASFNDLPDHLQPDRWVADRAAEQIAAQPRDVPLAMMVGFPGPHCPYDPPEGALDLVDASKLPRPLPPTQESGRRRPAMVASYKRAWAALDYEVLEEVDALRIRHHYAASVARLDADVGRIMDALEAAGRLENAVVIFASDHGDYLGDFGLIGKTYFHEPSIRVPLIVADFRRPAKGARAPEPVSLIDIHATLLDHAGLAPGPFAAGLPLGTGQTDRVICGATIHGAMARDARWKLVRYRDGTEALFDLAADPEERDDVSRAAPEHRARLDGALMATLLDGFDAAHADKRVAEAQAPEGHPFYGLGWQRPYPAGI